MTLGDHFEQVVVVDFEYEIEDGGLPDVLCMVAYMLNAYLQLVRVIKLWRGEFGSAPPFDVGPDTLFVAYSAWAEMTCFLQLGWKFPTHILDLHTAYLSVSNRLLPYEPDTEKQRKKLRKRLSDACGAYGIEGWEGIDKPEIAKAIAEGRWREYGREAVLDYCEEDVRASAELLRRMLRGYAGFTPIDVPRVLHWSNYSAKCIARIQARGMLWDVPLWNLVQENKNGVIGELRRRFDPSYGTGDPIYDAEGGWSYGRFERWLPTVGITAWPRLDSGALDTCSDAFRLMYSQPGIENLHALRDSVGFIAKARLPIGPDGRNRPSLFPFGTATGRNAHARSPYNAHAGVRGFIQFAPDTVGACLDWRTQEVAVAAVLSGDEALMADYLSGDVYHALARLCGLTDDLDPKRWKANCPDQRQRMKPLQLAINYGMGVPSLAKGLDRHPLIASGIIELHRRKYPRFWQWREDSMMTAMLERRIESSHGWPLYLTTSPNKRMLYNFPCQSGGAEMLRHATWKLCEADIVPSMLVHDGILFELQDREQVELAREIMRKAGQEICDGFDVGVDVDQILLGGARYSDKRDVAKKMWATIMSALEVARAIPRRA
jgi:DNA polymerase I